ncbi:hypothetical protein ACQ4PT_056031 [Festuca glaucescens]
MNFCSVTTSEGIGNTKDGFHSVQQRLSGFHASQCGYCTPGMCMSIFSALTNADKAADRPAPPQGFSKLTISEAEKSISGNLCRCTGYRPIVDACKSFAADVDLEDLGLNSFWKKGADPADVSKLPAYSSGSICTFPDFLKAEIVSSDKHIDINGIPELSVINRTSEGAQIGAAVSISKAIDVFSDGNLVFGKIADHLNKVATPFVRNTATIGGNIIMAQRLHASSDIATVLLAAGSTVTVQVASKKLCLTLEDFLEQPPCDSRTLLFSIFVLDWGSANVTFEASRASPRPFGNAVSYVNFAFLARLSEDASSGAFLIEDICLAFGAFGTKHVGV